MSNHSDETEEPEVKPNMAGPIIIAAVVGGVIGYLICHFTAGNDEAEIIKETGQTAIYQSYEAHT